MSTLLFEDLTYAINGAAMEVHGILGPSFLEAVYQAALEQELNLRGIPFQAQTRLDVSYKGQRIGEYIADLVVDHHVDRATGAVALQLAELEGLGDDALPGEGSVAVHEQRQHRVVEPPVEQVLLRPHVALEDRVHRLEVRRVGDQ